MESFSRLVNALSQMSESEMRSLMYDAVHHRDAILDRVMAAGYEQVTVDDESVVTGDGRRVVEIVGCKVALRPEVHTERLSIAFEAAKQASPQAETKSVVGTESLSALTCPKCGDALQHTSVCPKCAAGKLGYRHRYTCVCGGADLISKEPL